MFLNLKELPIAHLGKDTTLCEGNHLELNAHNATSLYLWQDNSTNDTYDVNKAGTYFVKVTKDGCVAKDTIVITYKLKPKFSLGDNQVLCNSQTILLKPELDPARNLIWQDGSVGPQYLVTQPGTYSLEASNACGTTFDDIVFTEGLCNVYVPRAFTPNGDAKMKVSKFRAQI